MVQDNFCVTSCYDDLRAGVMMTVMEEKSAQWMQSASASGT